MISAGDFRKGTTFEMDGDVYQIIDFQHVKPGKGAAFVRTKIKSVKSGGSREMTFNPNDKFEVAKIETKEMQYLYSDGELYYFMDTETSETISFNFDKSQVAFISNFFGFFNKFFKISILSSSVPNLPILKA